MLVGQHSNYLLRQIDRFRKGERIHDLPEDAGIFKRFGDEEVANLLAWLSVQDDSMLPGQRRPGQTGSPTRKADEVKR